MRKNGRLFMILGVMVGCAQVALSQGITILSTDLDLTYAVGNRILYHHDTLTATVDVGAPGGPSTWDFSGLMSNYLETLKSVSVGSTLYAANFPQATHAFVDSAFAMRLYTGPTFGWVTLKSSQAYYYYGLGSDLGYYGVQGAGNAYLDVAPTTALPFAARWFEVPASNVYHFPVSYGSSWSQQYTDSLEATATVFGSPQAIKMGDHFIVTSTVDGYGTLILPGGAAHDALRIRKLGVKNGAVTFASYIYVARNGAAVEFTGKNPSTSSGVDSVTSVRWTEGVGEDPVPVQMVSFMATRATSASVRLEWTTLTELNNFGFIVQRRGDGESAFTDLAGSFTPGHGTTLAPHAYAYQDVSPGPAERWYRLRQVDLDGTVHLSEQIQVSILTSVAGSSAPTSFALRQNFPNPFNPSTVVSCQSPVAGHIRIAVYDVLGREVAVLMDEWKDAGRYSVTWNASGNASGVYFCRMVAGTFVANQRMVMSK